LFPGVKSAHPESPGLIPFRSAPQESPGLFPFTSALQESPGLFPFKSAPPESPGLFPFQSAHQESPRFFPFKSAPQESPESFPIKKKTHSNSTRLGATSDPSPRPKTEAIFNIRPAASCNSSPTCLGPNISDTLARYPLLKPKNTIMMT